MLATTTADTLSIADNSLLKKAPSSIPFCLDLLEPPTWSSWSLDNSCLFIATKRQIQRYEPSSNLLRDIYEHDGPGIIQCLAIKDRDSVVFSVENDIHILRLNANNLKVVQSLISHSSLISSISISSDGTNLASSSMGQVHVHNLVNGSHVVLRGPTSSTVDNIVFHSHSSTRLLVASAGQVLVYDIAKPSSPAKTIVLSETVAGEVVGLACSPFSRTLVAIATSDGFVALLDLEKEKSLVRMINTKVALTAIEFTTEGGAMYLGTKTGRILILDLRLLDKPPKSITVSQLGNPIRTISVQKKAKFGTDVKTTSRTPTEPLPSTRRTMSTTSTHNLKAKPAPSPARARVAKASSVTTPIQRRVSAVKESIVGGSPIAKRAGVSQKKVLSPSKDPLGNSLGSDGISYQIDELAEKRRGGKLPITTPVSSAKRASKTVSSPRSSLATRSGGLSSSQTRSSALSNVEKKESRRTRTLPSSKPTTLAPAARKTSIASSSAIDRLTVPDMGNPPRRSRAGSSASQADTERPPSVAASTSAISTRSSRSSRPPTATSQTSGTTSRPSSSASRPTSTISRTSTLESIGSGSGTRSKGSTSSRSARHADRRSSTPDVPTNKEPVTPVAASKQAQANKKSGMSVLGLGTPEVDRWIQAGKQYENETGKGRNRRASKGKTVGFKDDDEDEDDAEAERIRTLSLQISPRRPLPTSGSGSSGTSESWAHLAATSPELSGLSQNASPSGVPSTGPSTSAHDLLKNIMQDVMFDFQRESKADMMGLHLDLLRMGRSWKSELRVLMDEYVGDLRELREENERLRSENERLRRNWA